MLNLKPEDITPDVLEFLERNAKQRAALMALVCKLLMEEDESLTIKNVKILIANFFSKLIDEGNVVMDLTERSVMEQLVVFSMQEELLEQFKN